MTEIDRSASVVSRRRILQGAAWAAPVIVLATAVPARATSGGSAVGAFVVIDNFTLNNLNDGGGVTGNFQLRYSIYNDQNAFTDAGTSAGAASTAPDFASWDGDWAIEVFDNGGASVHVFAGSFDLDEGQPAQFATVEYTLPATGHYSAVLSLTTPKVGTVEGSTLMNATPDANAEGDIT